MGILRTPVAIGKPISLMFSVLTLIPLALIYSGCTSVSSPPSLHFMRFNLTDFPRLGNLHHRSLGIAGPETPHAPDSGVNVVQRDSEWASEGSETWTVAEHAPTQPRGLSSSFSNLLHSHISIYDVGLWGYCQIKSGSTAYSKCSTPSSSLSVDLQSLFGSASTMLPSHVRSALESSQRGSRVAIVAYILGGAATLLAVLLQVISIISEWGKRVANTKSIRRLDVTIAVITVAAWIAISVASGVATVIYACITSTVNHYLQSWGAEASVGYILIPAWFSVIFSLIAFLSAVWSRSHRSSLAQGRKT